ncbi:MAG TPA: hypothetical protein VGO47_10430, partial [Chlamydiales bacterium]|nr:hypothetical protein [Chlamydiales bacterium]
GDGQIYVIVTMLPALTDMIHKVHATLHDNTYKHVFGKFNEWEVVIWDSSLNRRERLVFLLFL